MRTVKVSLGERGYPIHIGSGLLPRLGEFCGGLGLSGRCAVITDQNVAPHYACAVFGSLRNAGFEAVGITLPPGGNFQKPEKRSALLRPTRASIGSNASHSSWRSAAG